MSSLYLDHFGLRAPPFQITPDPHFFFSGGRRGDILSALLHVADHDEGITTLIAEVGSGKTLLARLMISRLKPETSAVYLANPCFSRDEILVAIARDLGLTALDGTIESKLAALHQELLRRHGQGQRVLLVIDEAHAMPAESLEEVRLLSNLETGQNKLVNIMLFGQPELDALLGEPRLRQVMDRVIHRFKLAPLLASEINAYIDHRLRAAGWQGAGLFSSAALARLVKTSGGRARRINLLADKALLAAYADGARSVEVRHVDSAAQELSVDRAPAQAARALPWRVAGWSVSMAIVLTAATVLMLGWYRTPADPRVAKGKAPAAQQANALPATAVVAKTAARPVSDAAAPITVPSSASTAAAVPVTKSSPSAPGIVAVESALPVAAAQAASAAGAPGIANTSADISFDAMLARTMAMTRTADAPGYTIQIAALPEDFSPGRDLRRITSGLDASKLFAHYSIYKDRTYVAVFYGSFESYRAATQFASGLPQHLNANRPMIRSWANIKQDATP